MYKFYNLHIFRIAKIFTKIGFHCTVNSLHYFPSSLITVMIWFCCNSHNLYIYIYIYISSIRKRGKILLIWALIHLYNSYKNSWEERWFLLLHSINSTSSWLACNYITWDWGVEQQVTGSVHTHNTNQSVVHKNKNLNGVFPSGWAILYIKKIFRLYSKYTLIILRKKPPSKTVLQNKSQSFSQRVWISYGENTCLQKRTVLLLKELLPITHARTHTHLFCPSRSSVPHFQHLHSRAKHSPKIMRS